MNNVKKGEKNVDKKENIAFGSSEMFSFDRFEPIMTGR